jgi:AraC-like DNA-binding protein
MILALSIFVFVLAIYIAIFNYKVNKTAYYLVGFFLLFASYSISHHLIINTTNVFWIAIFYNHLSPFWLLPGPLLYLYVKGTITDKNPLKNKWEYLNFLPAIIQFIGIIPYCLKPFSEKEEIARQIISNINSIKYINANWLYPKSYIGFLMRTAITTIYAAYSAIYLFKNRPNANENKKIANQQFILTYYWLGFFVTITILIGASVFITLYYLTFTDKPGELLDTLPSHLLSGMASFLLIICLLAFPNILYGMPKLTEKNPGDPHENSYETLINLSEIIIKYINDHSTYLDKHSKTNDLAIALNVPQHHVAYCFNHSIKQSFNEYRTHCQINYAKTLLNKSLTLQEVSEKSGFSTNQHFIIAFKKETGYFPTEYLKINNQ